MKKCLFLLRVLTIIVVSLLSLSFFPKNVNAQSSDFLRYFTVHYSVQESGLTHVTFTITFKNLTEKYYASAYAMTLGFQDIQNLKASDPDGIITPTVTSVSGGQKLSFPFNSRIVGVGNKLTFNISFDTRDVANKIGQIWEINIPGLASGDEFSDFTVLLSVPSSFGEASFMKPDTGSKDLTFTKDQLGKSGISLSFGNVQSYNYMLTYHLENKNIFPVRTEIALPPTTNYQKIYIDQLSPRPQSVNIDKDGNWIAQYILTPSEKINVLETGKILLSLTPREKVELSQDDRNLYTKALPFWEINDPGIKKIATSLKTPGAIYDYVVNKLKYDFSRVSSSQVRLGAKNVLSHPTSAVCLEFTDLFVTLARAAGIPAREVDGFAYTQNAAQRPVSLVKDILHAWPEYYDDVKHEWIMVDPTWGNTTGGVDYFNILDFDHIAFVIKGIDSTYPIPAGGYKLAGQEEQKDVEVTFAMDNNEEPTHISMTSDAYSSFLGGFPIDGNIILSNNGAGLFPGQSIVVTSKRLTPHTQTISTSAIPPFGSISIPFRFQGSRLLTNEKDPITIHLGTESKTVIISIQAFSPQGIIVIGGIIIGIFSSILLITTARSWSLSISRRKWRNPLRGKGKESKR